MYFKFVYPLALCCGAHSFTIIESSETVSGQKLHFLNLCITEPASLILENVSRAHIYDTFRNEGIFDMRYKNFGTSEAFPVNEHVKTKFGMTSGSTHGGFVNTGEFIWDFADAPVAPKFAIMWASYLTNTGKMILKVGGSEKTDVADSRLSNDFQIVTYSHIHNRGLMEFSGTRKHHARLQMRTLMHDS